MRDTLPVLVFYSLERKDDPCKSDSQTFYPFWKNAWHFTSVKVIAQHFTFVDKMPDTIHFLVFNSLERKDDPSDNPTFYPFRKNAGHSLVLFDKFCVLILLVAIVAKFIWMIAQHFTLLEKMRDTLLFLVFNSLERKDEPCKSDSPTFYPFWKNAWHFTLFGV